MKKNDPLKQELNSARKQNTFSATQLLERAPKEEYLMEWTNVLTKEKILTRDVKENSVLIFRLKQEWLALPTTAFSQVIEKRKIHHIPHRSGETLLGLVNIRGQMKLCVALHHLLQIQEKKILEQENRQASSAYMLVIEKEGELWVFPVDEIYGIYQCNRGHLENVPVTVVKSTANFLKGMIKFDDKSIGYLDEELLFYNLRRSLL